MENGSEQYMVNIVSSDIGVTGVHSLWVYLILSHS